jgi:hypothetical protein
MKLLRRWHKRTPRSMSPAEQWVPAEHDVTRGRSAGTAKNPLHDPTRGRSAGTAENPTRDPTRGPSPGSASNLEHDPTRSRPSEP